MTAVGDKLYLYQHGTKRVSERSNVFAYRIVDCTRRMWVVRLGRNRHTRVNKITLRSAAGKHVELQWYTLSEMQDKLWRAENLPRLMVRLEHASVATLKSVADALKEKKPDEINHYSHAARPERVRHAGV